MPTPILSDEVKEEINELTAEKIYHSYEFHELLKYGIDAAVHVQLMGIASLVPAGICSKNEIIKQYGLEFDRSKGFSASLNKIESPHFFIPNARFYIDKDGKKQESRIWLFNPDYTNMIIRGDWKEKHYAFELVNRKWTPDDIKHEHLLKQGESFGRDMWEVCVANIETKQISGQSRLFELSLKLIEYYSAVTSELKLNKK